jgi:hypothetical protein
MSAFEFLSVAFSFVIGLSVTYLLSSALSLFRAREICKPDWLPLLWALYILLAQIQFWWAIYELSSIEKWSLAAFLSTLFYSLLLYTAGGLILPHKAESERNGLRQYFEKDGRLGVVVLNIFITVSPIFNSLFFNTELSNPVNLFIIAEGLLGLSILLLKTRRAQVIHAVVWGTIYIYLFILLSPPSY